MTEAAVKPAPNKSIDSLKNEQKRLTIDSYCIVRTLTKITRLDRCWKNLFSEKSV